MRHHARRERDPRAPLRRRTRRAVPQRTDESRRILRDFGIDPFFSRENLVWAPISNGHHQEYTRALRDALVASVNRGGSKEQIRANLVNVLKTFGEDFKKGKFKR